MNNKNHALFKGKGVFLRAYFCLNNEKNTLRNCLIWVLAKEKIFFSSLIKHL